MTDAGEDVECPTCAADPAGAYVYAIGSIAPRFPSLAIERELMQATTRLDETGLTDRQTLQAVLSKRENRYLARRICWVFSVERVETYILTPRDPADLDLLIEALRPNPAPTDLDVVIGVRGPVAPPGMCGGLQLPMVAFDQLYSFDREALVGSIPRPDGASDKAFRPVAEELLDRVLQLAGNAGTSDEHRALNYLAMRSPAIYARTAEAVARNQALSAVETRPSTLGGARNILDVVFTYRDRGNDGVEKALVRVDVTEQFPFLTSRLAPYYDR